MGSRSRAALSRTRKRWPTGIPARARTSRRRFAGRTCPRGRGRWRWSSMTRTHRAASSRTGSAGLDPAAGGLGEGESAPGEGRNDFGRTGYRGPCPPPGHGRHRYAFRLYALDAELELGADAAKAELEQAIEGHVLTR